MPSDLAVVNCRQLVTVRGPGLGIIEDGAMLVRDGRIERVGTRAEIKPFIGAKLELVDAGGRVVLPGFVDAHTHLVFAGHRAEDFERRCAGAACEGIPATVRATRAATENELIASTRLHIDWLLRSGTTTAEAKSGYGLSLDSELKILRVIRGVSGTGSPRLVPTFLGAHEVPEEYRDRREAYLNLIIDKMLPRIAEDKLAEYCDAFCEEGAFTVAETRRVLEAARAHGLGLRLHADQLSNSGGAQLAAELHAATADHLEHTEAAGIAALAEAGVQPVLLPGSVLGLGLQRYPNARAMIDAGLAVVLATDFNPGSSPIPSIPLILFLACTQMKMTPAEAIIAATINAARSLGRGADIGSLEPGKLADFVIHDRSDYREVIYWPGIESAKSVWIGGRRAYHR
jgi:imidazolonepropionase